MNYKHYGFMAFNILCIITFVFTLPALYTAIAKTEGLALNVISGLMFILINFYDLTIGKWRKNGRNRNKS